MAEPVSRVERTAWRSGQFTKGTRAIPEETAIAFTYNGTAHAVMMATPQDLEDFAVGFSMTEGVVRSASEIESIELVTDTIGIELRMWLNSARTTAFEARRRFLAGPTGCGLCGIESLDEAMRTAPKLEDDARFTPEEIALALGALPGLQVFNQATRAVHAAAFYRDGHILALREDVGRHNALDKLAGAMARIGVDGRGGIGLLTSRLSVELVQKAAILGIPVLVAVSAPTALAVRTAEAASITIVAVARKDGFEIFTRPQRIAGSRIAHADA